MILTDSSVWIDYFRSAQTRQVACLEQLIDGGEVMMGDLIACEVLQGATSPRNFRAILHEFNQLETIEIGGMPVALEAARNYRLLRENGITVRKTIDVLIATRCIQDDLTLLYRDRDFDPFVEHLGLRAALADGGLN